jgi:hypothetical protein
LNTKTVFFPKLQAEVEESAHVPIGALRELNFDGVEPPLVQPSSDALAAEASATRRPCSPDASAIEISVPASPGFITLMIAWIESAAFSTVSSLPQRTLASLVTLMPVALPPSVTLLAL